MLAIHNHFGMHRDESEKVTVFPLYLVSLLCACVFHLEFISVNLLYTSLKVLGFIWQNIVCMRPSRRVDDLIRFSTSNFYCSS